MILIDCVAVVRPEARLARYVPYVSAHSMISGLDQPFSFSHVWIHTDESVGSIAALASGQDEKRKRRRWDLVAGRRFGHDLTPP